MRSGLLTVVAGGVVAVVLLQGCSSPQNRAAKAQRRVSQAELKIKQERLRMLDEYKQCIEDAGADAQRAEAGAAVTPRHWLSKLPTRPPASAKVPGGGQILDTHTSSLELPRGAQNFARKNGICRALARSMKNAHTNGTMMKARCEAP